MRNSKQYPVNYPPSRRGNTPTILANSEPSPPSSATSVKLPAIWTPTPYRMPAGNTRHSPCKGFLVRCHLRHPSLIVRGSLPWEPFMNRVRQANDCVQLNNKRYTDKKFLSRSIGLAILRPPIGYWNESYRSRIAETSGSYHLFAFNHRTLNDAQRLSCLIYTTEARKPGYYESQRGARGHRTGDQIRRPRGIVGCPYPSGDDPPGTDRQRSSPARRGAIPSSVRSL